MKRFIKDESGQGAMEYGLIIGLVVVGLITAMTLLRSELTELMGAVEDRIRQTHESMPEVE